MSDIYREAEIIEDEKIISKIHNMLDSQESYSRYLAEGMQEIYKRVEALEKENTNLKSRIIVLEIQNSHIC